MPKQKGRYFADDFWKWIFINKKFSLLNKLPQWVDKTVNKGCRFDYNNVSFIEDETLTKFLPFWINWYSGMQNSIMLQYNIPSLLVYH